MLNYPFIGQHDEKDCGAACFAMICECFGLKISVARAREVIKVDNRGANIYGLVTGAKKVGLVADALEGSFEELIEEISSGSISYPFIARIINEQMYEHFVVVYERKKDSFVVGDPAKNKLIHMSIEEFKEQWQEQIVTFVKSATFEKRNEKKGEFRKYFRFIFVQKKLLFLVFVFSVLISVINAFGGIIFQYILSDSGEEFVFEERLADAPIYEIGVDDNNFEEHGVNDEPSVVLGQICKVLIIMYIIRMFLQFLRGDLLALISKEIDVSLTNDYYCHLVDLPLGFHDNWKTGEFMSRFQDISKIRDAISTATLTIMLDTVMVIFGGVLLYCINAFLFSVTMFIVVFYSVILLIFRRRIKAINYDVMNTEAQVTSYLKETIDGISLVKSYECESMVKYKTMNLYKNFASSRFRGMSVYNVQESMVSAVASIGIVVLLWVGACLCQKNILDIADLFTFYYLISYFLEPVSNLINLQPELQAAIVAGERLNDVLNARVEKSDEIEMESNIEFDDIEIVNLDFRYGNRELVLSNLNMRFEKGKKIAIVGESGCGKSSVAKLLLCLYEVEEGLITLNGRDIFDYDRHFIRKNIAYVPQKVELFSDTIYNNLRTGSNSVDNEEVKQICKLCCIDDFIEALPLKYNTMIEENGCNLSGGQKQRLAIARALLKKPKVLIMDEATSNLDTYTEEVIISNIENMFPEMTCIYLAHRLNTVKGCDYIYVLKGGEIVEEGKHQHLLELNGLYRKLYSIYC